MRIRYFSDTDTVLLECTDQPVHETREMTADAYLDLDSEGNLVAMAIEHASRNAGMPEVSVMTMLGISRS